MAEKVWRLEVSNKIEALVSGNNDKLKEGLDLKHKRSDGKLFTIRKSTYLEEDVFKYFYPFCLVNCTLGAAVCLRQSSRLVFWIGIVSSLEYVYFLFSFPVESWLYHKRAISTNKPYA